MQNSSNRDIGTDFEEYIAEKFNAKLVPGSGSTEWRKGDVQNEVYCIQCKYTDKVEYSLKVEELIKSEKESYSERRDFLFCIGLNKESYVVERVSSVPKSGNKISTLKKSIKINERVLELGKVYISFLLGKKEYNYRMTKLDEYLEEISE